jgi:hypothetical protein
MHLMEHRQQLFLAVTVTHLCDTPFFFQAAPAKNMLLDEVFCLELRPDQNFGKFRYGSSEPIKSRFRCVIMDLGNNAAAFGIVSASQYKLSAIP